MEEKLREDEYDDILKKEDDIIVVTIRDAEGLSFNSTALISGRHTMGNETDPVNAVAVISQKDYEEFYYMVEEEFFNKVTEIYQRVKKTEMRLKEIAEKIKDELKKENEEFLFAYEE